MIPAQSEDYCEMMSQRYLQGKEPKRFPETPYGEESEQMAVPVTSRALEARERVIENSRVNHGAIYAHVAATKPQIFGPPQFAECPQCEKQYRLFNNPYWKGDQSVCQACADENFAFTRDKMQQIERAYADSELQQRLVGKAESQQTKCITGPFLALSGAMA